MHWDSADYTHPKYCLGIVFRIGNFNYFAPVSSIKDNQLSEDSLFLNDFFEKLSFPIEVERVHHDEIVASIKFNYMFPIHHADLHYVNTSKFKEFGFDYSYKVFVDKQYSYCLKHQDSIKDMAHKVYNKAILQHDNFHKYCLDFRLLEVKYIEWLNDHQKLSAKIFPIPIQKRL